MTRAEQVKICGVCTNRSFNPKHGIICGLTNDVAAFTSTCSDYNEDEREVKNELEYKKNAQAEVSKTINKGRLALFLLGGIYVFIGILEAFVIQGHHIIFGIIDWFIAAVFLGLGILSYTKASLAMIIGLSFYVLLILLFVLIDPISILNGIIWKILVISYLIYGIKTAKDEEKLNVNKNKADLLDQL